MCQELTPGSGLYNKSLSYKADILMGLPFTLISFKGGHCSPAKKWFFQALAVWHDRPQHHQALLLSLASATTEWSDPKQAVLFSHL